MASPTTSGASAISPLTRLNCSTTPRSRKKASRRSTRSATRTFTSSHGDHRTVIDRKLKGPAMASHKVIISCAITGSIHTPSMSPHLPVTSAEIAESALDAAAAGAAVVHLHPRNPFEGIRYGLETMNRSGAGYEFECYDTSHLYNLHYFWTEGLVKAPLFIQTCFGLLGGIGSHPDDVMHMKRTADRLFGNNYHWSVLRAGRAQMPVAAMAASMGGNGRGGL